MAFSQASHSQQGCTGLPVTSAAEYPVMASKDWFTVRMVPSLPMMNNPSFMVLITRHQY